MVLNIMYNKKHCQSSIRQVIILSDGANRVKIIVAGQHAHKWSVTIEKRNGSICLIFPRRKAAQKEVINLKQQFREFGDCCLRIS